MLSLKVEIQIQEIDASNLVSWDIYDDHGNITGQITKEEYDRRMKEAEGRIFFGLTASINGQHIRIHSQISSGNPDIQRNERAFMLSQGLAKIGDSIYRNFSA